MRMSNVRDEFIPAYMKNWYISLFRDWLAWPTWKRVLVMKCLSLCRYPSCNTCANLSRYIWVTFIDQVSLDTLQWTSTWRFTSLLSTVSEDKQKLWSTLTWDHLIEWKKVSQMAKNCLHYRLFPRDRLSHRHHHQSQSHLSQQVR